MTIPETVEAIVKGLPPSFLGLCVLNMIFLATFGWFVLRVAEVRQAHEAARMSAIEKVLTACLQQTKEPTP